MAQVITQLWPFIDRAGVVGMALMVLVLALVGLDRGWWYTGRDVRNRDDAWKQRFEDMKADRDEKRHERDEWRMLSLTQRGTTERATQVAEQSLMQRERDLT